MVRGCALTAQERIAFSVGDPVISTSPPSCHNSSQQQISFFQGKYALKVIHDVQDKKTLSN